MDTKRLYEILSETIVLFGDRETADASKIEGLEKVDCHFMVVGVNKPRALEIKDELLKILAEWPSQAWGSSVPKLQEGPSYIHVGGVVGDQGAAFQLFALGQVLGFWNVLIPEKFGITGVQANELAGSGFVYIDGFNPN